MGGQRATCWIVRRGRMFALFEGRDRRLERVCRLTGNDEILQGVLKDNTLDLAKYQFSDGWTPLHLCSTNGFSSCIKLLVARGAQINEHLPSDGSTPLMLAAYAGHTAAVTALLDAGASLSELCSRGFSALHYAASGGKTSVCSLLLDRGGDVSVVNPSGYSALLMAACAGKTETVAFFLSNTTAAITETENKGNTSLHMACAGGYVTLVDFLMQAGANHLAGNRRGKTPMELCRTKNRKDIRVIIESNLAAREFAHNDAAALSVDQQVALTIQDQANYTLYPSALGVAETTGKGAGLAVGLALLPLYGGYKAIESGIGSLQAAAAQPRAAMTNLANAASLVNPSSNPANMPRRAITEGGAEESVDGSEYGASDSGVDLGAFDSAPDSDSDSNGDSDSDSDFGDAGGFSRPKSGPRRRAAPAIPPPAPEPEPEPEAEPLPPPPPPLSPEEAHRLAELQRAISRLVTHIGPKARAEALPQMLLKHAGREDELLSSLLSTHAALSKKDPLVASIAAHKAAMDSLEAAPGDASLTAALEAAAATANNLFATQDKRRAVQTQARELAEAAKKLQADTLAQERAAREARRKGQAVPSVSRVPAYLAAAGGASAGSSGAGPGGAGVAGGDVAPRRARLKKLSPKELQEQAEAREREREREPGDYNV